MVVAVLLVVVGPAGTGLLWIGQKLQVPYFSINNAHPKLFNIPFDV
jgi:hypothetical protein